MTRVSQKEDPQLYYANHALRNCLYAQPHLDPYCYNGKIDWAIGGHTNSWLFYFHSLKAVGFLANAAEVSRDARYLKKAAEIIESWYDFSLNNPSPPYFAWYEASATFRVGNVIHFLRAFARLPDFHARGSFLSKLQLMLRQHADFLFQESNYRPNNHGLMASMALLQTALTFPDLKDSGLWRETALKRIRERIRGDLSAENVHREHSAFYHLFFLNLVLQVNDYLINKGISLFPPGDHIIEGMKRYLAYLVMPNGYFPRVGDTSNIALSNDYNHPFIQYSLSRGVKGTPPRGNSVVHPKAGVAILRDAWKSGEEFEKSTYVFFQAAFHSTTHKHADDLGFVLYSHGEEIFIGPGVYAYGGGKYRNYVLSTKAHNTLTVDGRNYPIKSENIGKAGLTDYLLNEAFDFVRGSHTLYKGVFLRRGIILIRPSTIVLIDEAISDSSHSIQQIFNLAPAARDLAYTQSGASFRVGEKGIKVEVRQLAEATTVRHYNGQESPLRGFCSPQQLQMIPIDQLEFERAGKKVVFATQISVAGAGETVPDIRIDLANPYSMIKVTGDQKTPLMIDLSRFGGEAERDSRK